jgi:hypothetical protein
MKKVKAILWGIFILFLVLLYFQNRPFFETKNSLMLDIYIVDAYHSPELVTAVWVLGGLVVGFLISYFFSLTDKFKSKKTVKGLRAKIKAREEMLDQLKKELETQNASSPVNAIPEETTNAETMTESTEAPYAER